VEVGRSATAVARTLVEAEPAKTGTSGLANQKFRFLQNFYFVPRRSSLRMVHLGLSVSNTGGSGVRPRERGSPATVWIFGANNAMLQSHMYAFFFF
jgi:hypothetical protein